jgi:DNA-binding XRE family transcriptional regulator
MNIEKLIELRKKKGLTRSALAKQIGVTRQSVSLYEKGARRPTLALLVDIAKVLECTTDELLIK